MPPAKPSPKAKSAHGNGDARALFPAVAVVVSRYNATVTDGLLAGARNTYLARGGSEQRLFVIESPGAYELPALCLAAAKTGRFAAVVALGCLIKGETRHDRYIAQAVAHGLVSVTLETGVPVCFGVLTVDTPEQAIARSGGISGSGSGGVSGAEKGNKGAEAMGAALETIAAMKALHAGRPAIAMQPKPDKLKRAAAR